jgi:hypothetical protein
MYENGRNQIHLPWNIKSCEEKGDDPLRLQRPKTLDVALRQACLNGFGVIQGGKRGHLEFSVEKQNSQR